MLTIGGSAITSDLILGSGSPGNHGSSGVLDLHLMEQDLAVLGELDITSSPHKPKISKEKRK